MALQVLRVVFTLMTKGKLEVKVVVAAAAASSSFKFHFANTYKPVAHCPKVNELVFCSNDVHSIFSKNKHFLLLEQQTLKTPT